MCIRDRVEAQKIREDLKQKIEKPWELAELYVFLQIPTEVAEKVYSQKVQNLNLNCSINPSGIIFFADQNNNTYAVVYWKRA